MRYIIFLLLFLPAFAFGQIRPDLQDKKSAEGNDAIYTAEDGTLKKVIFDSARLYFIPDYKTLAVTMPGTIPDSLRGAFVLDSDNVLYYVTNDKNSINLSTTSSASIDSSGNVFTLTVGSTNLFFDVGDSDNDATNEIQTLSISNDSIIISNGNQVDISPYLDNTDAQTLSIDRSGSIITLSVSGGNNVFFEDETASFWDNSGNYTYTTTDSIGIGTATPSQKLDITTDIEVHGIRIGRGPGNNENNFVAGKDAFTVNTSGIQNTAVGRFALGDNSTGSENTAIGNRALSGNIGGQRNTAVGTESLLFNTSGDDNTSLGRTSLRNNTTGSGNIGLGFYALINKETGDYNVAIGTRAGEHYTGSVDLTESDNSIFIGADTRASGNSETNQIVIGHAATGNGSNTTTIGNASTHTTYLDSDSVLIDGTKLTVPDYVFNKAYDRPSIKEHAAQMWNMKHLPSASSAEVINNGQYNITKEAMAHRKELELAHIYIEQLLKRIEALEKKVK